MNEINLINQIKKSIQLSGSKDDSLQGIFRDKEFSQKHIKIRRELLNKITRIKESKTSIKKAFEEAIEKSADLIITSLKENKKISLKGNISQDKEIKIQLISGEVGTDQHLFLCDLNKKLTDEKFCLDGNVENYNRRLKRFKKEIILCIERFKKEYESSIKDSKVKNYGKELSDCANISTYTSDLKTIVDNSIKGVEFQERLKDFIEKNTTEYSIFNMIYVRDITNPISRLEYRLRATMNRSDYSTGLLEQSDKEAIRQYKSGQNAIKIYEQELGNKLQQENNESDKGKEKLEELENTVEQVKVEVKHNGEEIDKLAGTVHDQKSDILINNTQVKSLANKNNNNADEVKVLKEKINDLTCKIEVVEEERDQYINKFNRSQAELAKKSKLVDEKNLELVNHANEIRDNKIEIINYKKQITNYEKQIAKKDQEIMELMNNNQISSSSDENDQIGSLVTGKSTATSAADKIARCLIETDQVIAGLGNNPNSFHYVKNTVNSGVGEMVGKVFGK